MRLKRPLPDIGETEASGRAWGRPAVFFAVLSVLAFGMLSWQSTTAPLHNDTIYDLLRAQDCLAGGLPEWCATGPSTSNFGLKQGATWNRVIMFALFVGWSIGGLMSCVLAAKALGVGLLGWLVLRHGGTLGQSVMGASTFLLCLMSERWGAGFILWNPSVLALPLVLSYYAAARAVLDDRLASWLFAGLTIALAGDCYVGAWLLAPLLFLAICIWSGRPVLSIAVAALGAVGLSLLCSHVAFLANVESVLRVFGAGIAALGLGAFGLVVIVKWLGGEVIQKRSLHGVVLLFTGGSLIAYLGIGLLKDMDSIRYLAPAFPGGAIVGAWMWGWLGNERLHRIVGGLLKGLVASVVCWGIYSSGEPRLLGELNAEWGLADAEILAEALRADGMTYETALTQLRGGTAPLGCHMEGGAAGRANLLSGVAAFLPEGGKETISETGSQILVAKVRRRPEDDDRPIAGARLLASASPQYSILLWRFLPWVDTRAGEACFMPLENGELERCVAAGSRNLFRDGTGFVRRVGPLVVGWAEHRPSGPYALRIRYRVRIPQGATPRVIDVVTDRKIEPLDPCRWRIADVEGVPFDRLSETTVRLKADPSKVESGWLVLSGNFRTRQCDDADPGFPPALIETAGMADGVRSVLELNSKPKSDPYHSLTDLFLGTLRKLGLSL